MLQSQSCVDGHTSCVPLIVRQSQTLRHAAVPTLPWSTHFLCATDLKAVSQLSDMMQSQPCLNGHTSCVPLILRLSQLSDMLHSQHCLHGHTSCVPLILRLSHISDMLQSQLCLDGYTSCVPLIVWQSQTLRHAAVPTLSQTAALMNSLPVCTTDGKPAPYSPLRPMAAHPPTWHLVLMKPTTTLTYGGYCKAPYWQAISEQSWVFM